MNRKTKLLTNGMLLACALCWGSGFAVRKMALEYMTPFFFNGMRFMVGFLFDAAILAVVLLYQKRTKGTLSVAHEHSPIAAQLKGAFIIGTLLAGASGLQQLGLLTTTAGKASFITSLYTIIVPMIGVLLLRTKVKLQIWIGACMAVLGLYMLSFLGELRISAGDLTVLACAGLYAVQILAIGHFSPGSNAIFLNMVMLFVSGMWNFLLSFFLEEGNSFQGVVDGCFPIVYSGIVTLGIAFLLQVTAQKKASPSIAAIILSLESVFGAAFGMIILRESMNAIQISGCALIFMAIILAQIDFSFFQKKNA